MYAPTPSDSAAAPPPTPEAQRNVRYTFLLGRLRNRQITMEEATELFGIMQAMLRMSEAARLSATRAAAPPIPTAAPPRVRAPSPAAPSSASDDLFLLGLLTMGAGAGLMTAVARRLTDGPATPATAKRSGTGDPDSRR